MVEWEWPKVFWHLAFLLQNRPSAELQNASLHEIPFKRLLWQILQKFGRKNSFPVFLRDLAKILLILNCFGHFCSKKRSGSEYGTFCRVWECRFPVGSGGFRWVPVKRPFSVKFWHFTRNFRWNSAFFWARFGGKLEIMVGKRKFALCTALCC